MENQETCSRMERRDIDRFQTWWEAYPKKMGKGAARRAWDKLKPSEELLHTMLTAISKQLSSEQWNKSSGEFIPMPSTWLNQERWNDEGMTLPQKQVPKSPGAPRNTLNIPGGMKSWEEYEASFNVITRAQLLKQIKEKPQRYLWFLNRSLKNFPSPLREEIEALIKPKHSSEIVTPDECPF